MPAHHAAQAEGPFLRLSADLAGRRSPNARLLTDLRHWIKVRAPPALAGIAGLGASGARTRVCGAQCMSYLDIVEAPIAGCRSSRRAPRRTAAPARPPSCSLDHAAFVPPAGCTRRTRLQRRGDPVQPWAPAIERHACSEWRRGGMPHPSAASMTRVHLFRARTALVPTPSVPPLSSMPAARSSRRSCSSSMTLHAAARRSSAACRCLAGISAFKDLALSICSWMTHLK